MSDPQDTPKPPAITDRIDAIRRIVARKEGNDRDERRAGAPKFEKWPKTTGPEPWKQDGFLKGVRFE